MEQKSNREKRIEEKETEEKKSIKEGLKPKKGIIMT